MSNDVSLVATTGATLDISHIYLSQNLVPAIGSADFKRVSKEICSLPVPRQPNPAKLVLRRFTLDPRIDSVRAQ